MNEDEKRTDEDQCIPWPVWVFLAFDAASLFFDVPLAVLTR